MSVPRIRYVSAFPHTSTGRYLHSLMREAFDDSILVAPYASSVPRSHSTRNQTPPFASAEPDISHAGTRVCVAPYTVLVPDIARRQTAMRIAPYVMSIPGRQHHTRGHGVPGARNWQPWLCQTCRRAGSPVPSFSLASLHKQCTPHSSIAMHTA
eukprot:2964679-Rhodomonas_salina.1